MVNEDGVEGCERGMAMSLVLMTSIGLKKRCVKRCDVTPRASGTPGEGKAERGTSGLIGGVVGKNPSSVVCTDG